VYIHNIIGTAENGRAARQIRIICVYFRYLLAEIYCIRLSYIILVVVYRYRCVRGEQIIYRPSISRPSSARSIIKVPIIVIVI
jgi:hypothetical protein